MSHFLWSTQFVNTLINFFVSCCSLPMEILIRNKYILNRSFHHKRVQFWLVTFVTAENFKMKPWHFPQRAYLNAIQNDKVLLAYHFDTSQGLGGAAPSTPLLAVILLQKVTEIVIINGLYLQTKKACCPLCKTAHTDLRLSKVNKNKLLQSSTRPITTNAFFKMGVD